MYTKNLEQLLRLLRTSRQSGLLTVESAEQDEQSSWQGQFRIIEGNVTSCQVFRKIDRVTLLSSNDAMQWLLGQGKLSWQLDENAQITDPFPPLSPLPGGTGRGEQNGTRWPDAAFPPATPSRPSWTPRRTLKGIQTPVQSLGSTEHLQVFSLVNGNNSVEGITRILRKLSPESIARALDDLRSAGLIE